jgi:hypothetical protein
MDINKKTEKVYCKNCKFETYEYGRHYSKSYCSRDSKGNPYNGYITEVNQTFDINEMGNCPKYQKKRWKFWIKG